MITHRICANKVGHARRGFARSVVPRYILGMDRPLIGTCSWKYPSWEGLVYSSREPANYLEEYARAFDTVEVDQWFWSLGGSGLAMPRRETVAEYDAATPAGFRFTVKCPNALTMTHHRGPKDRARPNESFLAPSVFLRFLEALAPLVPKVGLFMFQFEYLNRDKMSGRPEFLERLGTFLEALPADLPYGVEIRNPRWIDSSWFGFLRGAGAAPVLLQGYWMGDLAALLDEHGASIGRTACVRLHGEDREGMEEKTGEDWSRVVRPKDDELRRISYSIKRAFGPGGKLFVNVNNHYEGSAPITIRKLRGLFDEAGA